MYAAIESRREAADGPSYVEAWSTSAWPHEPGGPVPRTIALPDLGGPAVGGTAGEVDIPDLVTATMTDALRTRIAIQNLASREAEIAFDGYAECGYAGTETRTIDPYQAIVLPARELPGVLLGSDSALIRVLRGEVAVLAETARPGRFDHGAAPADLTGAYLGVPVREALVPPRPPTATLAVSPTRVSLSLPGGAPSRPRIRVRDAAETGRCLEYEAVTDVRWLSVAPERGPVPGSFALEVDLPALDATATHTGTVTVTVGAPAVLGSPQTVRVTVRGEGATRWIYLPAALQRHDLKANINHGAR
jgi:hypothetical protein